MVTTTIPTLDEVVEAYIACGESQGFARAETILLDFLPANRLDGKCYDVPPDQRQEFIKRLRAKTEE